MKILSVSNFHNPNSRVSMYPPRNRVAIKANKGTFFIFPLPRIMIQPG